MFLDYDLEKHFILFLFSSPHLNAYILLLKQTNSSTITFLGISILKLPIRFLFNFNK